MNIKEIAKEIAELHYPNKPNAIIDESFRLIRMKTLRDQTERVLNNLSNEPKVVRNNENKNKINSCECSICKEKFNSEKEVDEHHWEQHA